MAHDHVARLPRVPCANRQLFPTARSTRRENRRRLGMLLPRAQRRLPLDWHSSGACRARKRVPRISGTTHTGRQQPVWQGARARAGAIQGLGGRRGEIRGDGGATCTQRTPHKWRAKSRAETEPSLTRALSRSRRNCTVAELQNPLTAPGVVVRSSRAGLPGLSATGMCALGNRGG